MAKLIYSAITSLDGYIEDENGEFLWARPDDEVMAFINVLEADIGTYLFGTSMYKTMVFWEDPPPSDEPDPVSDAFGEMWRAANKIVYSTSLEAVSSARTKLERDLDLDALRQLKASEERVIAVGGSKLAAQLFRAELVDEVQLYLVPVTVGGGKPGLPRGVQLQLELIEERAFDRGMVYLHYRVATSARES